MFLLVLSSMPFRRVSNVWLYLLFYSILLYYDYFYFYYFNFITYLYYLRNLWMAMCIHLSDFCIIPFPLSLFFFFYFFLLFHSSFLWIEFFTIFFFSNFLQLEHFFSFFLLFLLSHFPSAISLYPYICHTFPLLS